MFCIFRFRAWIDSSVFNPICHPLGDVTYYLGYMFVTSQEPTSRGLHPYESIPAEQGNFELPARYPGDLTWDEELRLLFPVFLDVNPRTYFMTGRVRTIIPYKTLMQASKINPFLFASLVLQRCYDSWMKWPDLVEMSDRGGWRICNYVKFPPLKQPYPITLDKLYDLRKKVRPFRGQIGRLAENYEDLLPGVLTPEDRDNLRACDRIDTQYQRENLAFMRHLL